MSKLILEFEDSNMRAVFVANLLDGGGDNSCCVDYNEKTQELEYWEWDHSTSTKDESGHYNKLVFRR